MRMTTYGCWLSPLTRFAAPHCGGPSSEAAARFYPFIVREQVSNVKGPRPSVASAEHTGEMCIAAMAPPALLEGQVRPPLELACTPRER